MSEKMPILSASLSSGGTRTIYARNPLTNPHNRNIDFHRPLDTWKLYDSPLASYYDNDFYRVDPDRVLLNKFREIRSDSSKIAIDLMAPPTALRNLVTFPWRHAKDSTKLAVSLKDPRDVHYRYFDRRRGIHHLSGDLVSSQTWNDIEEWLNGRKADLIMERAFGGFQYIPLRRGFLEPVMKRMWNMLNPQGGIVVLQTPHFEVMEGLGIPVFEWVKQLKESGLYVQSDSRYHSPPHAHDHGLLMLVKDPHHLLLPPLSNAA